MIVTMLHWIIKELIKGILQMLLLLISWPHFWFILGILVAYTFSFWNGPSTSSTVPAIGMHPIDGTLVRFKRDWKKLRKIVFGVNESIKNEKMPGRFSRYFTEGISGLFFEKTLALLGLCVMSQFFHRGTCCW